MLKFQLSLEKLFWSEFTNWEKKLPHFSNKFLQRPYLSSRKHDSYRWHPKPTLTNTFLPLSEKYLSDLSRFHKSFKKKHKSVFSNNYFMQHFLPRLTVFVRPSLIGSRTTSFRLIWSETSEWWPSLKYLLPTEESEDRLHFRRCPYYRI